MGCNCATQEQLRELYRKYGTEKGKKLKGKHKLKFLVQKFFVYACMIAIIPFIFIYVFTKAFDDDKKIDIQKFLNLKNNVTSTNVG